MGTMEAVKLVDADGTPIEVGSWVEDQYGRVVQVKELTPYNKYEPVRGKYEISHYRLTVRGLGTGSTLDWLNPDTMNLRGDWTGSASPERVRVIADPEVVREVKARALDAEEREIKKFIASLEARLNRNARERERLSGVS